MSERNTYSKAEIELILGVKRGRIQEWVKKGHIKPYLPATQGETALFDRLNLYQINLFVHLLRAGASRIVAADMLGTVETNRYLYNDEKVAQPPLESDGAWRVADEPPQFEKEVHKSLYIINLERIRAEVDVRVQ